LRLVPVLSQGLSAIKRPEDAFELHMALALVTFGSSFGSTEVRLNVQGHADAGSDFADCLRAFRRGRPLALTR